MAEKLKSALKTIHWSLVFKAFLAGLAWAYLPWWISALVLLGIYFIPIFQARNLFTPFLTAVVLGWIFPSNLLAGLVIAFQVYLILGIKDFIFINRKAAMQMLSALYLAESGIAIYLGSDNWILKSFIYGILFGLVYLSTSFKVLDIATHEGKKGDKSTIVILAFLLSQIAFGMNFLPIAPLYRSLLLILASIIFFEWQNLILFEKLSKNKIISYGIFFVGFLVLVFSGISWGL